MIGGKNKLTKPVSIKAQKAKKLTRRRPKPNLTTWATQLLEQEDEERKWGSEFRFCNKQLDCGHECDGVFGESECLPCLHVDCGAQNPAEAILRVISVTERDLCSICFDELGADPCVRVCQNHIFHANCILGMLEAKWTTMSVTFAFLGCPACKKPMSIEFTKPKIGQVFEKWINYRTKIENMAK